MKSVEQNHNGGCAIACAMVAMLLVGCGGGSGTGAGLETVPSLVFSVQAFEPPASALRSTASTSTGYSSAASVTPSFIALGALSEAKALAATSTVGPRQIGAARQVPLTMSLAATQQQMTWQPSAQGGLVSALSFSAEGAYGLRLGVLVQKLPASALLRVYRQDQPTARFEVTGQGVLKAIERNLEGGVMGEAAATWWTPDTGGDEATLEIELPAGIPTNSVQIAVPTVSHLFVDLSLPVETEFALQAKINESDPCNIDATCRDSYASLGNAIARMVYTSAGKTYLCTGTLLNDRDSTATPYFVTANHCISNQAEASTLQTHWFYRSPICNSRTLFSGTVRRTGGATLLYASDSTDVSFLRLADVPPSGAVFAAWDANAQAFGSAVTGLHHPAGDLLKISSGAISGNSSCRTINDTQFSCSGLSGNFYRVNWTEGTTEGGSSGSGIFRGGALIGTLYGGSAVCSNSASSDYYGRFDVAYAAALYRWLSPGAVSVTPPVTASTVLQNWIEQLRGRPGLTPRQMQLP